MVDGVKAMPAIYATRRAMPILFQDVTAVRISSGEKGTVRCDPGVVFKIA
jgi:hypothetical protein